MVSESHRLVVGGGNGVGSPSAMDLLPLLWELPLLRDFSTLERCLLLRQQCLVEGSFDQIGIIRSIVKMGNCQAAEAAAVVILHPNNKVERIYWSVSANEVMTSNPGHYVALIITSPVAKTGNDTPVKHLKLLRPDDTLLIGQVYRLVNFEDVLKEFAEKKCKKLGKLLKERGALNLEPKNTKSKSKPAFCSSNKDGQHIGSSGGGRGTGRHRGGGQWRPALQSIAEIGT